MNSRTEQSAALEPPGFFSWLVAPLWVIPLLLCALGLIMITSVSSQTELGNEAGRLYFTLRQLQWVALGLAGMFVFSHMPLVFLTRYSGVLWFCSIVLMALTVLPGLGLHGGGAARWIRLGGVSLQPSEMLFFFFAVHLSRKLRDDSSITSRRAFGRTMLLAGFSLWPFLLQPDYGGALALFLLSMGIYVQVYGWKWPLSAGAAIIGFFFLPILFMRVYRIDRIKAFMDPWSDPTGRGFQTIQGFISFANGKLLGVGVGKGLQKMHYLPAAHTDFILAALGEEMGLLGTGAVLVLFSMWFYLLFFWYVRLTDPLLCTLLWAVAVSTALPMLVNMGGILRIIPLTGMPLPFISYGGSSMLFMWCRVGLALRLVRGKTA